MENIKVFRSVLGGSVSPNKNEFVMLRVSGYETVRLKSHQIKRLIIVKWAQTVGQAKVEAQKIIFKNEFNLEMERYHKK